MMDTGSNFLSILRQNRSKIDVKLQPEFQCNSASIFYRFWPILGARRGARGGSNESVSSIKNRTWEPQGRQTSPGSHVETIFKHVSSIFKTMFEALDNPFSCLLAKGRKPIRSRKHDVLRLKSHVRKTNIETQKTKKRSRRSAKSTSKK